MSNIYQEAIAEAKKLKEVAEQNAKNAIIEAVAPRIKRLVEQELETFDDSNFEIEDDDLEDAEEFSPSAETMEPPLDVSVPDEIVSLEDEEDGENITVNITVEGDQDRIQEASRIVLSRLKTKRHNSYVKRAAQLLIKLKESRNSRQRKKILKEIYNLNKVIKEINYKPSSELAKKLTNILKEENSMSRRNRRNNRLNENAWWLFEAEEGEEAEGEELDLGGEELELEDEGEEEGGGDVDVDAIKDAVAALADAVGMEAPGEGEEEELELEDEGEEEGDELDLDLEEVYRSMREADEDEEEEKLEEGDKDEEEEVEISESMLRREIMRMQRSSRRPSSRRRRRRINEAEAMDADPALNHGGEVIEVDEDTLINALAEELGDMANNSDTGDASKHAGDFGGGKSSGEALAERRRRSSRRRVQESRKAQQLKRRALLAERKAAAAQKELKESNLFNAKLLYVNKLMQNHNLNSKQQRTIVEALDNAKTLREAKLLYTSLTDALRKRKQKSNLNESVNRSGSASKSIRSAAPVNNGSEMDRWATLAGIKK